MTETKWLYAKIPYSSSGRGYTLDGDRRPNNENSVSCRGYGEYPYHEYPDVPVIRFDLATLEQVLEALAIPNDLRPNEASDIYSGTVETYFEQLLKIGIVIENLR